MADSWDAVLSKYGRFMLAEVLEPAIGYALEGFPLSPDQRNNTAVAGSALSPEAAAIYTPGGVIPCAGSRFQQKQLAATLRTLAAGGRDAFYKGKIAEDICDYMLATGGYLTRDDFADHQGIGSSRFIRIITGIRYIKCRLILKVSLD